MRLFRTLPPLDDLLVQWTTKRDSTCVTGFMCTLATTRTMGAIAPHILVPVKAIVVQPPSSNSISGCATMAVFIPQATPPSCHRSPGGNASDPMIVTIPSSCVRDKDGNPTNAFDVSLCGVGRTVMLVMSLGVLSYLINGMALSGHGVTLVPQVPLSLLPPVFSRSNVEASAQLPKSAAEAPAASSSSPYSTPTINISSATPSTRAKNATTTSSTPAPPSPLPANVVMSKRPYNWEC